MDASPRQIALYGHIAERLRDELAKRQWSAGDLNEALGFARQAPTAYIWLRAEGGAGIACAFAHWPWTAWLAGLGGGYWCAIAMAVTGER